MELEVQQIKPEQTYNLRHNILRPHQPFKACQYETDHDHNAFHIGAFHNDELVSVGSIYLESHPEFNKRRQYRLRAMATAEAFRNKGAGRAVVDFAEKIIKLHDGELLWCKGRTTVEEYYQKLGFKPFGEVFDYPPIGPHLIMYKKIQK
ncbi:GNAT family N-acetyltransferase [Halobacillus sp. H74]|uniref:GNAT family N-acetyltransferase n=1 Tax=Halobacillus sp. H74 TaxID=3457436 RepID=UPI003FCC86D2